MDTRTCNPIREARRRAGLSQRQLADRLGVHKVTVSGWENGRFLPRPAHARSLCRALGGLDLACIYAQAPPPRADHTGGGPRQ